MILINNTNNIKMEDVGTDHDILGRTYEYCIAQFAAYEGVKGEPFEDKMKRLTSELSEMFAQSNTLQEEIKKNLASIGFEVG